MGLNWIILNQENWKKEKKIVGAICDLLAKYHSQYGLICGNLGWIACAI